MIRLQKSNIGLEFYIRKLFVNFVLPQGGWGGGVDLFVDCFIDFIL